MATVAWRAMGWPMRLVCIPRCPLSEGIAVAPNGDVYLADYQDSVVQKISASTGLMTLAAGMLNGSTKSAAGVAGFSGNGAAATSAEVAFATRSWHR